MSEFALPPVDAVTQGWWDATRERNLVLQLCQDCRNVQHYPRAICLSCGGGSLGWTPACGDGVVDSVSVVHRAVEGFEAPYVVARVRLEEGPILLTNLVGRDPSAWKCDDQVSVHWRPLSDGRNLPVFAPAGS